MLQQPVEAGLITVGLAMRSGKLRTSSSTSAASRSSLTTTWCELVRARASSSRAAASRRSICSGWSVPRPTSRARSAVARRRRDEDLHRLGHRLAHLAGALDLDLEHDARAARRGSSSERSVP